MAADGVTCTTVGVATHGVAEDQRDEDRSPATDDGKAGTSTR